MPMNGRSRSSDAAPMTTPIAAARCLPVAASQTATGQRKNFNASARPERRARDEPALAVAPGHRDEQGQRSVTFAVWYASITAGQRSVTP